MSNFDPNDFEVLYPGVYTEREKPLVDKFNADIMAIKERGPIDVDALINGRLPKDTPGLGPVAKVTEAMVRYNSEKYDPENPLLNDAEYAKRLGYENILAFPCFGAHDDSYIIPWPPESRDTILVSQLSHSVTTHKPIVPGDTLYMVIDNREVSDLTDPKGSIYRNVAIKNSGSVYNQKGEKVNDVSFSVMESVKTYKEDKRPGKMGFDKVWEGPDWTARPEHYYTDEDWEIIKNLWSKEKRRGSEPLYWEDVKAGDEPVWTVDGPILKSLSPEAPYGLGCGGSRTIRKELLDPELSKTLVRDPKNGIWLLPNEEDYVPAVPDGAGRRPPMPPPDDSGAIDTRDIHAQKETRAPLINFLGRELACRHLFNWMGDYGWLYNIKWGIMPSEAHAAVGKIVPKSPYKEQLLTKVPHMKDKAALAHGLTTDLAVVKSYVYDKFSRKGEYFAELAWWIETIEGDIWLEGGATVKLPSKKA